MPTREELLIVANERGLLEGKEKAAFDQAVSRGMIKLPEKEPLISQGEAGRRVFGDELINFGLNAPAGIFDLAGDVLSGASSAVQTAGGAAMDLARGEPTNIREEFGQNFDRFQNTFPVNVLEGLGNMRPEFDATDIRALNSATTFDQTNQEPFSDRFAGAQRRETLLDASARTEHPGTTTVAEMLAGGLEIFAGRKPFSKARVAKQVAQRKALASKFRADVETLPPEITDAVVDVLSARVGPTIANIGTRLKRAGGKSAEAALEGAFLAAVNEGDPSTTAGLAAGTQAIGSASLFLTETAIKHPLPAVAAAWLVAESFRAIGPGEQDFFASKDFAVQKLVAGFSFGLLAAAAGAGRLRGPKADKFPNMMDAFTAVPRGAITSRLEEFTRNAMENNQVPMQVSDIFKQSPSVFNENQRNALSRAMLSPRKNAWTNEVNRLLKNKEFSDLIDSIQNETDTGRMLRVTPTHQINR